MTITDAYEKVLLSGGLENLQTMTEIRVEEKQVKEEILRGERFLQNGKIQEALDLFESILEKDPENLLALNDKGVALNSLGKYEEAIKAFADVISIDRSDSNAVFNLISNYFAIGALGEIDKILEKYGACLSENDVKRIKNDLALMKPHYYNKLGGDKKKLGRLEEAITNYRHAIALKPNFPEAHINLGIALREKGELDSAIKHYREALKLQPSSTETYINLAHAVQEKGKLNVAMRIFQKVLQIDSASIKALAGVSSILEQQGEFEKALDLLNPLIETKVYDVDVALAFAKICRHFNCHDKAIEVIEQVFEKNSQSLALDQKVHLLFALGELNDNICSFDRAFEYYRQANKLKPSNFEPEAHAKQIDRLMKVYNSDFMKNAPCSENISEIPIFIVGMPRSGTSLIEQILSSHPEVYGAGELIYMDEIVSSLSSKLGANSKYPECLMELTHEKCNTFAKIYLDRLNDCSRNAHRIIDKMPYNFLHIGFISLLFPNCRVIHAARNPLDTCLSCYFQNFMGEHGYTYDLKNIGEYYKQYQKLMQHWKKVSFISMMEVGYEDLISDQEKVSRDIVQFCGLEWNDRCLRFYDSKRVVRTASYDQVRQPIYKKSVDRWKNYEPYLDPLKEALG